MPNYPPQFLVKSFFIFLLAIAPVSVLRTQQPARYLTAEEAIDSALAHNRDLGLARLDEKIAAAKHREMNAIFLPQADLSYTALTSNNPLNALGFKLQQQTVKQSDFNPALLNDPGNTADFSTRLQVKQPLLNMDLLYIRRALAVQTSLYELKTQRSAEYLAFEVKKAYQQLQLAYEAEAVLKEAVKMANALYVFTNNRVKEGLLQQSDALQVKVRISTVETQLAEAGSDIRNASDYLGLLMGTSYGIIYSVAPPSKEPDTGPVAGLIPADRADFAALKKALESADLMIESSRKSFLPKVNAFASWQLNDNSPFGFAAGSYFAGLQITWDLFRGNSTKNKIITQQAERSKLAAQLQSQQEQSQLELNKTRRRLADALYMITQQQVAVENAAEALRILQDRYEQGLVNSTDVLQAQTQLSRQQLGKAQAVFIYNSTLAYLQFLTSSKK
ncbi:MAG: TolC family protein [Sphingobacteriales bacterium]|nr:TolC family protein [Sphingobacteriales bacterium]